MHYKNPVRPLRTTLDLMWAVVWGNWKVNVACNECWDMNETKLNYTRFALLWNISSWKAIKNSDVLCKFVFYSELNHWTLCKKCGAVSCIFSAGYFNHECQRKHLSKHEWLWCVWGAAGGLTTFSLILLLLLMIFSSAPIRPSRLFMPEPAEEQPK